MRHLGAKAAGIAAVAAIAALGFSDSSHAGSGSNDLPSVCQHDDNTRTICSTRQIACAITYSLHLNETFHQCVMEGLHSEAPELWSEQERLDAKAGVQPQTRQGSQEKLLNLKLLHEADSIWQGLFDAASCQQASTCDQKNDYANAIIVATYFDAYRDGAIPSERLTEIEARVALVCAYVRNGHRDATHNYRKDLDAEARGVDRLCDHPPW